MRGTLVAVAGVVIGVLVVLVTAALVFDGDDDAPPAPIDELSFPAVEHDEEAAQDLVVAWERWRTASFVTNGRWTRTLDSGVEPLTGDVYRAQQPPRRLFVELGAVTEEIDGELLLCDAVSDQLIVPNCAAVTSSRTFDERVRAEMTLVLGYVLGDERLYDVGRRDDGCFGLDVVVADSRSPWGLAAQFCFDDDSGALVSSRVRRQSAVDEEFTTSIRVDVSDADF